VARKRQSSVSKKHSSSAQDPLASRWMEVALISMGAFAILLFMSLVSYTPSDPGLLHAGTGPLVHNMAGRFGAALADFSLSCFGFLAYMLPVLLLVFAWNIGRKDSSDAISESKHSFTGIQVIGLMTIIISSSVLAHFYLQSVTENMAFMPGGLFGNILAMGLTQCFNEVGSLCVSMLLLICGITLLTGLSWVAMVERIGKVSIRLCCGIRQLISKHATLSFSRVKHVDTGKTKRALAKMRKNKSEPVLDDHWVEECSSKTESHVSAASQQSVKKAEPSLGGATTKKSKAYATPKIQLLDPPTSSKTKKLSTQQIEQMSRDVERHLKDFNISVNVVGVSPGPVVTRFELELAAGTKVSKISGLAKDLARSLSVTSVRIVEVIPGKPVIGLEIPNECRDKVMLRSIISSKGHGAHEVTLPLALGKDVGGEPVVVDLAKMPHCLVAGTTGSGKSVGINAMLLSLLYRLPPNALRVILIDPKMLELSIYEGIPHLLTPVVTDMKDAAKALRWCVNEMEKRYRLMAAVGVRNIAGYNAMVESEAEKGTPMLDPLWVAPAGDLEAEAPALSTLPNIVVCADEFADMIMVVGKKVEELITRLAQKARAAGIHLILATQRPSVDVITGLIKANIPVRLAFQVSSKIDSRTILDQQGAEQLLGHGDMLYLAPGTGVPIRVHGAFVGDAELRRVTDAIKAQGEPQYLTEIAECTLDDAGDVPSESSSEGAADAEKDALYDQAVQIVIETKRASISNIQRRLKIGYNRAARIVDAMEASGLVTSMDKNGARSVNVSEYQGEVS
jgi:DNA segregation ATPase FtsK/SpoIIIE, S-DNA-T family